MNSYNQHADVLCILRRTTLMKRRESAEAEVAANA